MGAYALCGSLVFELHGCSIALAGCFVRYSPRVRGRTTRSILGALLASLGLSCQTSQRFLEIPGAVSEGDYKSALFFFEREIEGEYAVAAALDLSDLSPRRVSIENAEDAAVLALLYRSSLADLEIEAGELRTYEGEGARPVDPPDLALRTNAPGGPWQGEPTFDAALFPWRVPPRSIPPCPEFRAISEPTAGDDSLNSFRAVVALDAERVLLAGGLEPHFRTEPDGGGEIAFLDGLSSYSRLPLARSTRIVTGLDWDRSSDYAIATSADGQVLRINLSDGTITSSASLPAVRWSVSIAPDGTTIASEAPTSASLGVVGARSIDVVALRSEELDTPEPLSFVVVSSARRMLGAVGRRVYSFDGLAWSLSRELERDVVGMFRGDQGQFGVISGGRYLHVLNAEQQWLDFPELIPDLSRGLFLGDGRPLVAGGSGAVQVWDRGRWCDVLSGIGRNVAGVDMTLDGRFVFLVTHGSGISRLEIPQ